MAKLKKTKNELKTQREALRRYERFLPTLELKKQQLQREIRRAEAELRRSTARRDELLAGLGRGPGCSPRSRTCPTTCTSRGWTWTGSTWPASTCPCSPACASSCGPSTTSPLPPGSTTPSPCSVELIRLRAEVHVLERQRDLLAEELRLTSQRVNLFEKVMIPRTLDNIRVIRIALGDAQTAAVARAKLAKSKNVSVLTGKTGA